MGLSMEFGLRVFEISSKHGVFFLGDKNKDDLKNDDDL